MFVRLKTIKGNPYAYLVENEWTPWGSRQKVTKYLGRAHEIERIRFEEHALPDNYADAINTLLAQELTNHGFIPGTNMHTKDNITVHANGRVTSKGKSVVLSMNEGFLCTETLKQLRAFLAPDHPEQAATRLAEHLLETGLKPTNKQFEHLFTLAYKHPEHF